MAKTGHKPLVTKRGVYLAASSSVFASIASGYAAFIAWIIWTATNDGVALPHWWRMWMIISLALILPFAALSAYLETIKWNVQRGF